MRTLTVGLISLGLFSWRPFKVRYLFLRSSCSWLHEILSGSARTQNISICMFQPWSDCRLRFILITKLCRWRESPRRHLQTPWGVGRAHRGRHLQEHEVHQPEIQEPGEGIIWSSNQALIEMKMRKTVLTGLRRLATSIRVKNITTSLFHLCLSLQDATQLTGSTVASLSACSLFVPVRFWL